MNRIPTSPNDPVNTDILMVAEDRVKGFRRLPFHAIAEQCGHPVPLVIERLKAMMEAGVVRRVRQTLLATKLAQGALVAWRVPEERLEAAFDWMKAHDPFTGHVVLRNTDSANPGADYRLWTTIKVPVGCGTLEGHCDILKRHVGADDYVLLPARGVFALGVGHMRRRNLQPGDKTPEPAPMQETKTVSRFATFLEHVRAKTEDGPVTKYNGLFHWTVPAGMEIRAGSECGRHICMTHCYWRTGGDVFGGAQIMGVVHGLERDSVMEHKAAIDRHLDAKGIPVLHTAVFWGERSEIKPSEISPEVYEKWLEDVKAAPTLP